MAVKVLRARPLFFSILGSILLSVVLLLVADALSPPESNVAHAADHMAIAVPGLLLAWSIASWCPRRKDTRTARWGRTAAVAGLAMSGAALVLESIGAFGYDGNDSRIDALTTLHNTVWVIDLPGMLILLMGIVLGVCSLFQRAPDAAGAATERPNDAEYAGQSADQDALR